MNNLNAVAAGLVPAPSRPDGRPQEPRLHRRGENRLSKRAGRGAYLPGRCCRAFGLVAVLILAFATAAAAHSPPRRGTREIVRLQGYRGAAPSGVTVARATVLVANGVEHGFSATSWRVFRLEDDPAAAEAKEPPRHMLQADFDVLARFAKARPEQMVTILAERRPGSADLFVLTLDLCPPK